MKNFYAQYAYDCDIDYMLLQKFLFDFTCGQRFMCFAMKQKIRHSISCIIRGIFLLLIELWFSNRSYVISNIETNDTHSFAIVTPTSVVRTFFYVEVQLIWTLMIYDTMRPAFHVK
jgi:hypothetical protein